MSKSDNKEELPKQLSSGRCVICVDGEECCMNCIRLRKRRKRSPKKKRKER